MRFRISVLNPVFDRPHLVRPDPEGQCPIVARVVCRDHPRGAGLQALYRDRRLPHGGAGRVLDLSGNRSSHLSRCRNRQRRYHQYAHLGQDLHLGPSDLP